MVTATHKTRVIVGTSHVSCIATGVDVGTTNMTHDRTPFANADGTDATHRVFIKGRPSHTLAVMAMFDDDTTAGGYWATLTANDAAGTLTPVTVAPAGLSAGSAAWLANAYQSAFKPTSEVDGAVDLGLDFDVTGPALFGQSITALAAVTADGDSAAVDGGAASSNGGVGHLHVTAVDTPTTLDVDIEHSVDGTTGWSVLASFTQVGTSATSERVVVAAGTTVRRYLRAAFAIDGTSYTCAVAFARA